MHNQRFLDAVEAVNGRQKQRFNFKINAKIIINCLNPAFWRSKILAPMCSALFYLILLAHVMFHDAKRLFKFNR